MSGLVLKLAPRERVLINGAVIENGERRSRLAIMTPNAIMEHRTSGYIMNPPSANSVRSRYWEPTETSLLAYA